MRLAQAMELLDQVEAFERVALGKARKKPDLASLLGDEGFLRSVLREARLLQENVGLTLDSKEFRAQLKSALFVDWKGSGVKTRDQAIGELVKLLKGLPSKFLPGAKVILDEEGKKVLDKTHQDEGKKNKNLRVDPIFGLKNERAVKALGETSAVFFHHDYERRAERFRERAQKVVTEGLSAGLDRSGIAQDLAKEFRDSSIAEGYWETVAAVHVARARSFSSVATYAESGVTKYQVLAIIDSRTTQICQALDGKIFEVKGALDGFDALEGAKSLDEVKTKLAPFIRPAPGDWFVLPSGAKVFTDPKTLQSHGVHVPPYHYRCRSTIAPVFDDEPQASPAVAPPPVPAPPTAPPPGAPVRDPVEAAKTPEAKQQAVVDQLREDGAFVPGQLPVWTDETFWGGQSKVAGNSRDLSEKLSQEFRKLGRQVLDQDPELKKKWEAGLANNVFANREGAEKLLIRTEAVKALIETAKKLGQESFPKDEQGKRRMAFADEAVKKAAKGKPSGNYFVEAKGTLTRADLDQVRNRALEFFDAWGPVAEQALKRHRKAYVISGGRAHNNEATEYFSFYGNKRPSVFAHELGHSIEHHVVSPRDPISGNRHRDYLASYWRQRVEARDPSEAQKLSTLTGNSAYKRSEVSKRDKWGDPYMGKTYETTTDSTEVVAMLSEAFGGNSAYWVNQFHEDPDTLLEFVGWMRATIKGEQVRAKREAGKK